MSAQFVDPHVSRSKFDREIEEYRALEREYRARGWLVARAEFPEVLVILAAPQLKPPSVVTGVAFDYTNYDAAPPSVRLVKPFTGEVFLGKELPVPLNRSVPGAELALPGLPDGQRMRLEQVQPLMQSHSPDDVPFLCIAGVREYHEHPGHSGDPWEIHRASGAGRLVRLLEIIDRYGIKPLAGYAVNLVPQISFQFGEAPT